MVAQILHNRGVDNPTDAKAFMHPKLTDLHPPEMLAGCEKAARRIGRAIAAHERIVIYGDYDVDGMSAVAILRAALSMGGADVHYYVPHRLDEGYGVNTTAIRRIIDDKTSLMITVDCGISAAETLAEATGKGMDVIVTDHHTPPAQLPDVSAIVHPAIPAGRYPNPNLCGAGVAFKLAWQVAREVCGADKVDDSMREFLLDSTCLAALGTIADIVPLVGENRTLAVFGLRGLRATGHVGLRALLETAQLTDKVIEAYHVAFVLGPRLNACGRMGHARLAVEMLAGAPEDRCRKIAEHLEKQNTARRCIERTIAAAAVETVIARGMDGEDSRSIVLASDDWHGGVIGIVASRLVDRFHRPTVLITINDDGCGQGSARSVPGFHMRDALGACSEHLVSYGGHAMAGGLRITADKVPAFAEAFDQYARQHVLPQQLTPSLDIDAEVSLDAINMPVVEHLGRLAPFGHGNSPPMIAVRSCRLVAPPKRMGRTGQAVSLLLENNGARMRAVGFSMGELADHLEGISEVDVAGQPMLNEFNGRTNIEIRLKDVIRKS